MKFDSLIDYAFASWKAGLVRTPLCLLGPPGIGKSSCAVSLADRMTEFVRSRKPDARPAACEVVDLSSRMPEDIGGIPYRGTLALGDDRELVVAEYGTQKWLARMCQPGVYGVLLLDDLPAAAPAVQVASRQLALDRRVGDARLSDGVIIMLTGNRREDKSGASTLPAHFRNSVCLVDLDVDFVGWAEWYGRQEGYAPVVASFLRFKPALLSTLPKDADSRGAFATPRTWAKLGQQFSVAQETNCLLEVSQGLVGEGAAVEFLAYVNVKSQLVNPEEVLENPEKALPNPTRVLNTPDKMHAMVTGLGEVAAAWYKDPSKSQKVGQAFLKALAWTTQQGQREYVAAGLVTFTANGGGLAVMSTAMRTMKNSDPVTRDLAQFLNKTFQR